MKKKLITSALPYVNNVPHLGNIIGCVLSADVYSRYCKSMGQESLYICATDEYGTATEKKALEEGLTPKEICDKFNAIHEQVYKAFNIDFDAFGRTSHPEHIQITQEIFKGLEREGNILEETTEQSYCEHDKKFLADRYVEGICPHCNYDSARGDQCDQCGKLLQPTELKEPKCQICGNKPTTRATSHLYIDLPKLEEKLKSFQETSNANGAWSSNAVAVSKSWIEMGLKPRPITRDLKWGVPVPKEGFEDKVFYVWFDAPIGYISATIRALPDTWKDWWQSPETTELYQFMAKDNIPFHTVVFPASLLGTGENWTMLHHISATEYLNYEDTKFSKSRGIGVFGTDVMDLDIPIDMWRFYLLHNRPEKSDSAFTWEGFVEDVNSNFIDNIGNLLNRVLAFYNKNFEGEAWGSKLGDREIKFITSMKPTSENALKQLEAVQLRDALNEALAMGRAGNKFFHENEPWKEIKTSPEDTKRLLVVLAFLLQDVALLLAPYMPETSEKILKLLGSTNVSLQDLGDYSQLELQTPPKPEILFPKLDKKVVAEYKAKFEGKADQGPSPIEAFASLEIKVGEIKSIEPHPEAERLYVETIDLGEGHLRTIVSGLVKYYKPEELLGKRVLVASNLKSANLRGVESQGMVLACETKKKLEVLFTDAEIGAHVYISSVEPTQAPKEITIDEFFACPMVVKSHQMEVGGVALEVTGLKITTTKIGDGKIA